MMKFLFLFFLCFCIRINTRLTLRKVATELITTEEAPSQGSINYTHEQPYTPVSPSLSPVNHGSNSAITYFEITAFLGSWRTHKEILTIPISKLDFLIYASFDVDVVANTCTYSPQEKKKVQNNIQSSFDSIKQLKKNNRLTKLLANVGGWNFSASFYKAGMVQTEDRVKQFVANCTSFIMKHSIFDGINIDLQFPCPKGVICNSSFEAVTSDDSAKFDALVKMFSKELGDSQILTLSSSADPFLASVINFNSLETFVSKVFVITYDFFTNKGKMLGHQSAPYSRGDANSADKIARFYINNLKVPSEKLAIGSAFYGRGFKTRGSCHYKLGINCVTEPGHEAAISDEKLSFGEFVKEIDKMESYFDEKAMATLYFSEDSVYSIETEKSVIAKSEIVKKHNLGGLFVWEILMDTKEFKLLNAIYDSRSVNL